MTATNALLTIFKGKILKKKRRYFIDSTFFRLHYSFTITMLTAFTIMSTFQLLWQPIQCTVDPAMDETIMNTYCWITSTYTLPGRLNHRIGSSVIAPGVGSNLSADEQEKYHAYYQWTVFVLVFEMLLFYFPHFLWKCLENGRLEMLLCDAYPEEEQTNEEFQSKVRRSTDFLSKNKANNNRYFYIYTFCETLNLANVIGQIFFLDLFLGYEFTTYGAEVFSFTNMDSNERVDPMDRIFPKVTKCVFRRYGPSGNIVNYDGLCVLPLNIIYEKVFVFLWFWYVILALITLIGSIYRICTLISHNLRTKLILSHLLINKTSSSEKIRGGIGNEESAVEVIMNRFTFGDWYIFYQISKTLDPINFKYYVFELAKKFGWKEPKHD